MKQFKFNSLTHLLLCTIILLTTLVPSAAMAQSRAVDVQRAEASRIPEGVSNQDGRLIFDNADTFGRFMQNITNQSDEVLNKLEEQLGFRSMRRYAVEQTPTKRQMQQAGEEGIDADYWMIVPDPYLATALNPQGVLQIGEDVHRVSREAVYTTNVQNQKALRTLSGLKTSNLEMQEGIQKSRITLSIKSDTCTTKKGKYRLKGTSWIINLIFFSSAGASSKFQKRTWVFFWKKHNADQLGLFSDYDLNVSGVSISSTFSSNQSNEDYIGTTLASDFLGSGGTFNWPSISGTVSSTHTATRGSDEFICWTNVSR